MIVLYTKIVNLMHASYPLHESKCKAFMDTDIKEITCVADELEK